MDKTLIVELKDESGAVIGHQYSEPNGKFSAEDATKSGLIEKVKELEEVTKYVR